jgi:hypothetical protein
MSSSSSVQTLFMAGLLLLSAGWDPANLQRNREKNAAWKRISPGQAGDG